MVNAVNGVGILFGFIVPRRERRGYEVRSLAQPFRVGIEKSHQIRRAFTPLYRTKQIADLA
jgi:hypothetical protein